MSQYTKYPVVSGGGSSGITSLTGGVTASGPGAATATVVTNANLTGDVTSVGNATTLTNAPVISKVLTGYTSGVGVVSASDSILSAIQKLNGNSPGTSNTAKIIFVSQDTGNDSNLGTMYSPLKTIQAGITKAETIAAFYNQVIVNISPGSSNTGYNENLTMSQQGVTLQAYSPSVRAESVLVKGTLTINLVNTGGGANFAAGSNIVYIKGLTITASSSSPIISFTGSTFQRLNLTNSYVENTGTGPAISMTNTGVSGVKSTITTSNTNLYNNSATVPTILCSAGRYFTSGITYDIQNNNASGPSLIVDGASATGASLVLTQATMAGQLLVTDNLATVTLSLCAITSGSLPGIVTPSTPNTGYVALANVGFTTTATNTITGSGVAALLGGNVKISSGGDIISTVTQTTINSFPQGALLLGVGSTQTTNSLLTIKNGHIKSQQSTAPTIAAANSGTSPAATLSNATDTAGKINYTTGSGSITNTATCTITFNKAHATAPIVVLTPQNTNAGANAVQVYVTTTTTTAVLNFVVAPALSTTYNWFYHVIETQ